MLMLNEVVEFIEAMPAIVTQVKMINRPLSDGRKVYTFIVKTADGDVPTLQLRGRRLYRYGKGLEANGELIMSFENHPNSILDQINAKK